MSRILAIDDNPDNLITVSALLKLFLPGSEILTAQSGKEGIQQATSEQPDTILLDIHMPEMDGFEVCKHLKDKTETAHIPIIILTAIRTDSKSRVKALELGADAFLTKPIDESELAAQVKAMLRIKQAEDTLRNEKNTLEELVAQRVNDLSIANKQLIMEMEEREKAQADARMKSKAIENSLNGFDIVNEKGVFIYVNKAYVDMWGYDDAEEILGTSPDSHCLDPSLPNQLIQTLKEKKECKLEFTAKRKDGSTFEVLMYARLSYDENGEEIYPTTSIDITDQKNAQKERVLLQKQLIQAQKMEAVGALAGGIAHDFNNILYPILGYAELLKEDFQAEGTQNESVHEILQAALRAKALVKQILAFSRQDDLQIRPIKIQPIVKEVLNLVHSIIPSTISIEASIDKTCRPIMADPTQIHQMIMNLVTNAYHSMQETGGMLWVNLKNIDISTAVYKDRRMMPGKYTCLKIKDTGTGIKPDIIDNIFNPYFTTKGLDKGTGLGLSVVHGIVKNSQGEIFVKSTPSKGTCFEIYLPAIKEKTHLVSKNKMNIPKGTEHILLVDDEKHVSLIEARMLERLGYQITEINDSNKALELFSKHPNRFDILITDLTMPGLTGTQLSKRILKINPEFPIIMATGFSENMNEDSAKKLGIRAFLLKPIIISDLAQTVRKILDSPLTSHKKS